MCQGMVRDPWLWPLILYLYVPTYLWIYSVWEPTEAVPCCSRILTKTQSMERRCKYPVFYIRTLWPCSTGPWAPFQENGLFWLHPQTELIKEANLKERKVVFLERRGFPESYYLPFLPVREVGGYPLTVS